MLLPLEKCLKTKKNDGMTDACNQELRTADLCLFGAVWME